MKPVVGFFDLACCEGCQLQMANLGEGLLDLLEHVQLVQFRETMSETWPDRFTAVFIEGSVTNEEAEHTVQELRKRADVVVAYGACAAIGGINGIRDTRPPLDVATDVYGDKAHLFPAHPVRAVSDVIPVDYTIPGCPVYPPEIIRALTCILSGIPYVLPDTAVCVECIFNENVCMYERGVVCMGPVTRSGCNAWCTGNGNICYGCRGAVTNPNRAGAELIMQKYSLDADAIMRKMTTYMGAKRNGGAV